MTKEEKALDYAKEAWGVYFDDKHPDSAIECTCGEITQNDYLSGYTEGMKDSQLLQELIKISEKYVYHSPNPVIDFKEEDMFKLKNLIKELCN